MKHGIGSLFAWVLLCAVCANATLIIHVQNPFRDDSSYDGYSLHVIGSVGNGWSASSSTIMTDEGDDWWSYTWDADVSDYSWETLTIQICSSSYTCSSNYIVYNVMMTTLFATDAEIYLYYDSGDNENYTVSTIAPGSKIVWFKSPWGNKALPQMVFGSDSILMRFAQDDETTCGWFYGGISPEVLENNPSQTAYFFRYYASYLVMPEEGSVDLSSALASNDTIFIDGTSSELEITTSIGSLGECFDSTRTLHAYSPWRTNSTYKDSLLYISVGNNILNNATAMDSTGEYRYWFRYDFDASAASASTWSSSSATVQLYRAQNEWPQVVFFETTPIISDFFPSGVYEAWLFTATSVGGSWEISFAPTEQKVVRLMSPWDDMSPSMLVNGDTVKMGPITDTCGWYQGAYYKHLSTWEVYFKETFGFTYYSADGEGDGDPIVLDSILIDLGLDTIWVMPYPTLASSPNLYSAYPGRLGVCPTLQISAMIVDWAGEAFADSIDVDFGGIYDGNDYTTVTFNGVTYKTCQGTAVGMVQDTLVDGLPARVDSLDYPWDICSAAHEIEKWFVPVVVATDDDGNSYTNATCYDLDLELDEEGFWLADISEDDEHGGFFPLDDFEYLDDDQTIKNPKFDDDNSLGTTNNDGVFEKHNYSFAMKISAEFQYVQGQYFEFRGDDDVWVFIDGKLVVDIGGCHSAVEGAVDLDTLGLTEGETYSFHIFFSERNATGSNFKMRTSINLQTEKTYYPVETETDNGTIMYDLYQLLIDESLSCDVSSTTKIDTVAAASVFVLTGGSLGDGVTLSVGLNYGGIYINETMSGFTIDTTAIVKTRGLAPGTYTLYFYLESDQSQYSYITFTVPEYPLPTIAFVDSLGNEIDPDTVELGTYAYVLYPVYVMIYYYGEVCTDCVVPLVLSTSDSLSFYDSNSVQIDTVYTDSSGMVMFYVMGNRSVTNASFTVGGDNVDNELVWSNINLEEPPVPVPSFAEMHDRTGDGVADSLVIKYNDVLTSSDYSLDTVAWMFGDTEWHRIAPNSVVSKYIENDSSFVLTADSLVDFIFTGETSVIYKGSSKSSFTYVDSTGETVEFPITCSVEDKVPPIVTRAVVVPRTDNVSVLSVYFSESLDSNIILDTSLFQLRVWREGTESSAEAIVYNRTAGSSLAYVELWFRRTSSDGILPTVGDSIRFTPSVAYDLNGNLAHTKNPWVRIEGEQTLTVESSKVFELDIGNLPEDSDTAGIIVYVVSTEKTLQEIEEEVGLPGQLVRFDLSELFLGEEDLDPEDVTLSWDNYIFTNLGAYINNGKGSISCADDLFNGDCRTSSGLVYVAWNARSKDGRVAATGAYITKLDIKIRSEKTTVAKKSISKVFGIRRVD